MTFVSESQRRAVFARLMGNSLFSRIPGPQRLENEIKPLINPTFREQIDFENMYDSTKTYAQNKKYALKELNSVIGDFSKTPEALSCVNSFKSNIGIGRCDKVPDSKRYELMGRLTPLTMCPSVDDIKDEQHYQRYKQKADNSRMLSRDELLELVNENTESPSSDFSGEPLYTLEREERALKKKLDGMGEHPERDARSEILKRLEYLDAEIKKKNHFSLDEYNLTPRAYKRLRGDLLEGLAAGQITSVEYAEKMFELDARKQEYDNL